MKNQIIKWLFAVATLFTIASCDVNDYNEEFLDGFDPNPGITDIQTLTQTLEEADYKAIAENKTNEAIAKAAGLENELKNLAKQMYFTDKITAETYLPAYLAAKYSNYLSNGSKVKVIYNNFIGAPEGLADLAAAKTYELKAADYSVAWGGEQNVEYFTPAKPAASYLPRILKTAITTAEAGDYYIAVYEYSDQEPSTGDEPGETITPIKDIVAAGDYTVEGWVAATYARGFILSDAGGSILIYHNAMPNYPVGTKLKFKGAAAEFNGCMQFDTSKGGTTIEQTGTTPKYQYPASPAAMTGAQMDAYLTTPTIKYVSYTGTLSISGNYYNVAIDGAATATGSLSFPFNGQIDASLNGKKVDVKGYLFSVSKSSGAPKFANTIVTSISESGTTPEFTATGIVNAADPGSYKVKGSVVALYARGFLVNDGTGAILVYLNKESGYSMGDIVTVDGTTTAYAGLKQYGATATVTKLESKTYTQPAPEVCDGVALDAYLTMPTVKLVKYTGTLKIEGNYYNVIFDDAVTAQGSLSYPITGSIDASLNGKKVDVTGYLIGVSSSKFTNTMVVSVAESKAPAAATRAAVTTKRYALYKYSGSAWDASTEAAIVNPEDYKAMGLTTLYFSTTANPDNYLPAFLKLKFPYAQADAVKDVVYHYGDATTLRADQYSFNGNDWVKTLNVKSESGPFELVNNKWSFNPSQTIIIYPVKNNPVSAIYYQAGCDYVIANKPAEYRYNKTGKDGEYYGGCSAFYGNLSWKYDLSSPSSPIYYWNVAGEDISMYDADKDPKHVAYYKELEKRFAEVMAAGLGAVHADAATISGVEILYTLRLGVYTGIQLGASEVTHDFVFRLVSNGKFEYVGMTALDPKYELFAE